MSIQSVTYRSWPCTTRTSQEVQRSCNPLVQHAALGALLQAGADNEMNQKSAPQAFKASKAVDSLPPLERPLHIPAADPTPLNNAVAFKDYLIKCRDFHRYYVPELGILDPYLKKMLLRDQRDFLWFVQRGNIPLIFEKRYYDEFISLVGKQLKAFASSDNPAFSTAKQIVNRYTDETLPHMFLSLCVIKLALIAESAIFKEVYPSGDLDKHIQPQHQLNSIKNWKNFDIVQFAEDTFAFSIFSVFVKDLFFPYDSDQNYSDVLFKLLRLDFIDLFKDLARRSELMAKLPAPEMAIVKTWRHVPVKNQLFLLENSLVLKVQEKAQEVEPQDLLEKRLAALLKYKPRTYDALPYTDIVALYKVKVPLSDLVWVLQICWIHELDLPELAETYIPKLMLSFLHGVASIEEVLAEKASITAILASIPVRFAVLSN